MRVESMGLLKNRAGSAEVRDELLNAALHDPNVGVRLEALEGLKPLLGRSRMSARPCSQVLRTDDNPAVRMEAVDVLVAQRDDSMVGALQNLYQKEDNSYVRLKLREGAEGHECFDRHFLARWHYSRCCRSPGPSADGLVCRNGTCEKVIHGTAPAGSRLRVNAHGPVTLEGGRLPANSQYTVKVR